ncbi:peptidylprolyl isomerase [Ostreiculturibacter nitratireducens]|uniref:peptidylprolyl isomerase n=1 Tax=Ostreiculturibacter nitratireducens TaxID=3075226 RepID=UPI0031B5E774
MPDHRFLAGAALALALSAPAFAAEDGPGPNLVIEVAGSTSGTIVIDLLPDVAPQHVAQITALASEGAYNGVVFHRVIEGFMAQTGDVEFGRQGGDLSMAGAGGSQKPNVAAEFSDVPFERGTVGMARAMDPNSANSQFFIMFDAAPHLDGQYTVFGQVVSGMEVVDAIKKGDPAANGSVTEPDYMVSVSVAE